MRFLTADTIIRLKAEPAQLPKRKLTAETKICLSKIKGLKEWHDQLIKDEDEVGTVNNWPSDKKDHRKQIDGSWPIVGSEEDIIGKEEDTKQREYSSDYLENKKKLSAESEKTKKKLTKTEIKAIRDYTTKSDELNAFSRGEKVNTAKIPQLKAQQQALDSALKKSKVGENVTAYRTTSIPPNKIDSLIKLEGLPISEIPKGSRNLYLQKQLETTGIQSVEKGYISTTINPNYKMNNQKTGETFLSYKINIPKEAHGLYLGDLSKIPHQEELLVLRNYSLDIKRIKYDSSKDRYDIIADLILNKE